MPHADYQKCFVIALMFSALSGCLPTEESSANPTNASSSDSSTAILDSIPDDTRLVSNPNEAIVNIEPYVWRSLEFTGPIQYRNEARLFLKVHDEERTFFMGEVEPLLSNGQVSLEMKLLLESDTLTLQYQLFGSSGQLPIYFSEVLL